MFRQEQARHKPRWATNSRQGEIYNDLGQDPGHRPTDLEGPRVVPNRLRGPVDHVQSNRRRYYLPFPLLTLTRLDWRSRTEGSTPKVEKGWIGI